MRPNRFMDRIAGCWLWLSSRFHRRPLAVLGLLLGAVIWVGLMAWLFVETEKTQNDIDAVAAALCGGKQIEDNPLPPEVQANCRLLFDRLFESATPDQLEKARLRLNP